ncbi:MAG: protease modulator HflC [Alphaproteobacteria bacterium]|nr:protease modulator HflC [Alphaproteobacteria bacterium]
MRPSLLVWLFIGVGVLIAAFNTLFIVDQTRQAVVLRFGDPQAVITDPGLYVKAPFIDEVRVFDKRNINLALPEQTINAADQERLVVDAFVRWRIIDPLRFYQAVSNEEGGRQRLVSLSLSALRRVLGGAESNAIIRTDRARLMQAIENELNREAPEALGARVVDVRIRQAELPQQTTERVFERMRSDRAQEAARLRAEGQEEAARIRAAADRDVTIIAAEAREEAERTRGVGDGERAQIFARAYGRDAEFAAFYRSMRAYEEAIPEGRQIIIPPEGEFFRYMRDKEGGGR